MTAGPCREPIDPVRYISNRSSGKMGYSLAMAARDCGAEVILVSGPTALNDPAGIETVRVETTREMYNAVKRHFADTDFLIMAAAPADYRTKEVAGTKIKKGSGNLPLELAPTIDILKAIQKDKKSGQVVVGFALETDNAVANASAKLKSKGLDLIILNSMEKEVPFDADTNEVILIYPDGRSEEVSRMDKAVLAGELIRKISELKK